MPEPKFIDLLIIGDDLTPDAGQNPQLCTDRDVIAQDLIHMIRERGYLPPLIGNRNQAERDLVKVEITIAVDNDNRIVPGSAEIEEPELGTFYLFAETIDFGPVKFQLTSA